MKPESCQSSAAHQFPTESSQSASQLNRKESQPYKHTHRTSVYEEDLVEEFYEQLKSTMEEIPRKDIPIIIQGEYVEC